MISNETGGYSEEQRRDDALLTASYNDFYTAFCFGDTAEMQSAIAGIKRFGAPLHGELFDTLHDYATENDNRTTETELLYYAIRSQVYSGVELNPSAVLMCAELSNISKRQLRTIIRDDHDDFMYDMGEKYDPSVMLFYSYRALRKLQLTTGFDRIMQRFLLRIR